MLRGNTQSAKFMEAPLATQQQLYSYKHLHQAV